MTRLLDLNPVTRMTVDEALAHPYFEQITKDMPESNKAEAIAPTLNFNFEKKKLNLRQLKKVIEKEVSSLKSENLASKRALKDRKEKKQNSTSTSTRQRAGKKEEKESSTNGNAPAAAREYVPVRKNKRAGRPE